MHDIYRILNTHLGVGIGKDVLQDYDKFMTLYGKSISTEIIMMVHHAMKESIKDNDDMSSEYRISVRVEKCRQFPVCKGEYIG
jgi:hypothetical protein